MSDNLDRFIFEDKHIRGEIVSLSKSYEDVLSTVAYPKILQELLGELMAAAALLTATLKFEGEVSLQLQGEGAIKYAVVHTTNELKMKGIARWDESQLDSLESLSLSDEFVNIFGKGSLVITLTPKYGQHYQGIVQLNKPSLASCLEEYFTQSEQLLTKVYLFSQSGDNPRSAGMLIQVIPQSSETSHASNDDDFQRITMLTNTLTLDEVMSLSHKEVLRRLYSEDDVRLLSSQKVSFHCDCSKQRSASALRNVDKNELLDIIKEDGEIKMDCQFCHATFIFDEIDVENIHSQNFSAGSA